MDFLTMRWVCDHALGQPVDPAQHLEQVTKTGDGGESFPVVAATSNSGISP